MIFLSNLLQTILIPLHNPIEGFKFLNNIIGQFILSCNLYFGRFSDNVFKNSYSHLLLYQNYSMFYPHLKVYLKKNDYKTKIRIEYINLI